MAVTEPTRKMRQLAQLSYGQPWHTATHREAYAAGMSEAKWLLMAAFDALDSSKRDPFSVDEVLQIINEAMK